MALGLRRGRQMWDMGGGIGDGSMQEAGRKMQAHVDEAEARRRSSKGPHHERPKRDGFFKKMYKRLTDK